MSWTRFLAALLLMGVLAVSHAAAQTTFAAITGVVTDTSSAVVPGAVVEARHAATGYRYSATANESGQYTLSQLREGEYELRARAAGFKEFVAQVTVAARDVRRLDMRLEVGAVETTVEVTAGATLIETETARVGDVRTGAVLRDLPLNSRGLVNFTALTPTVGRASTTDAQRRYGGGRQNQSDMQIDGITIADGRGGNTISPLVSYIESYQEVRVDTANNSAEFGPIGVVTVVSKSGSNQLRGSVFDYYSTPWFRARNPFSPSRETGIRHWPGAAIGGPVVLPKIYNGHGRTFFYYSYETSRGSAAQTLLNPTVPLPAWRAGDFSALPPTVTIRDPLANNAPFAGNRIPAARINSVSQKIQERFYPLPNFGDSSALQSPNYRELKARPFDPETYWTSRVDHRFSDRASVFGRFTWHRSQNRAFESNLPGVGQRWNQRDTRAAAVSYTHQLRPNLLNEVRWGLNYNDNPRHGPIQGLQLARELGIQGLAGDLPDIQGIFKVSFSGVGLTGITQTDWRHPGFYNQTHQFQEQLNWVRGRHSMKAGVLLGRTIFRDQQAPAALFGSVSFSNRFTGAGQAGQGHPYADFLLGIPTSASRAFPPLFIGQWRWSYEAFVADQFKVTPRLTLDLGLRYEARPAWRDQSGRQSVFDISTGRIVVSDGSLGKLSPLMPRGYIDVIEAREAGLPGETLIRTDRNNFAPRIGVAFRPWGNRTAFRGGYGFFYDTVPIGANVGGVPFQINEPAFTNPAGAPTVVFPRVFPASVAGPATVSLPAAIRADLRIPYSMQWNFTVEHERWRTGFRASYIGTNTRQGEWVYDINQPVADTRPYVDKPRRFLNYPAVNYRSNGAGHQYHGLTLEAERQFSSGLFYQLSWTWSRDIGDLERGESPENAYDRRRERAVWADIPTHRVIGALVYDLPFGRGGGRARRLLAGGWRISAIFTRDSGQFLTPLWTGPDPTGTRFTASRTAPQVTLRPNVLRDPNLPAGQRSPARWFDVGAFERPAPGSFGTSAKGVIHGPGSTALHAGVFKTFTLRERLNLRWELTTTNVPNHPNWANPETNISSAAMAGVITGVGSVAQYDQAGPRSLRTGLRLEW